MHTKQPLFNAISSSTIFVSIHPPSNIDSHHFLAMVLSAVLTAILVHLRSVTHDLEIDLFSRMGTRNS
jgi:hypothetical protein